MNKYQNYLIACLFSLAALSSCSDDDNLPIEESPVLTPIADHILGRWNLEERAYMEDGEWVATSDGHKEIVTFRPDGTMLGVYISPTGRSTLTLLDWGDVNDEDYTFTSAGHTYSLLRLTQNLKEVVDEDDSGNSKDIYRRIDSEPLTLAERMVGRWRVAQRFDKVDGEWVEVTTELPTEIEYEYTENANLTAYVLWPDGSGNKAPDIFWQVYEDSGVLVYYQPDSWEENYAHITLEEDDTRMVMSYGEDYDPDLDEQVNTEYKEILMKVK